MRVAQAAVTEKTAEKAKDGEEEKREERERERLKDGNNSGQATHARYASTHGARKPPGPIIKRYRLGSIPM